jgi:hypothetical protein
MKLTKVLGLCSVILSAAAVADPYKAELSAQASRADFDKWNDNLTTYGGIGTFYFDSVETGNVPLAEAAYLGKNSSVYAGAAHSAWDHDNEFRLNSDVYSVGAQFFIPENFLYAGAGVSKSNYKNDSDSDWYVSVGLTPIDGLLITTSYAYDEGYDPNISAKYVVAIGNSQFINLEASVQDADEGNVIFVGGDFYFDSGFSIGGLIGRIDSNNAYQLRTRKFFSEKLSGSVSCSSETDLKSISVGVALRF